MATQIRGKRMLKERKILETPNEDYFVFFEGDDDLFHFHAYIIGPADSLYTHKLIKLKIDIPSSYPMVPPKVHFIQHSGGRIHPNLYVEGTVCLSILGTWEGEEWAYAMNINTLLISIRSLLDNSPYKHEPGMEDDPDYNSYVLYTGWKVLLIDYVQHESHPIAKAFLEKHVYRHGKDILKDLKVQIEDCEDGHLGTPYCDDYVEIDCGSLVKDVTMLIEDCKKAEMGRAAKQAAVGVEKAEGGIVSADKGKGKEEEPKNIQGQVSMSAKCVEEVEDEDQGL